MPGDEVMIVVMKTGATSAQIDNVIARIEQFGCRAHVSQGVEHTIVGIIGNDRPIDREQLERMDGVERTVPILRPFKLASRDFHPENSVITINGTQNGTVEVGGMTGPSSF